MATATDEPYFNPWDPEFRANPYPHYKPLLASAPKILDLFGPAAMIARYADVVAVLRDHARFSSVQPKIPEIPDQEPERQRVRPFLATDLFDWLSKSITLVVRVSIEAVVIGAILLGLFHWVYRTVPLPATLTAILAIILALTVDYFWVARRCRGKD